MTMSMGILHALLRQRSSCKIDHCIEKYLLPLEQVQQYGIWYRIDNFTFLNKREWCCRRSQRGEIKLKTVLRA